MSNEHIMNNVEEITIYFPKEGVTLGCCVVQIDKEAYRLEEGTVLVESASYGDIVRLSKQEDGTFVFRELIRPSGFQRYWRLLSKNIIESEPFQTLLAEVTAQDGYWQQDFGGVIDIYLPFSSTIEIEAEVNRIVQLLNTTD
jgi:hypothetical protein